MEGNVLFHGMLNTFYLGKTTPSIYFMYGCMVSDIWSRKEGRNFNLMMQSTHFIYRYMALDIW